MEIEKKYLPTAIPFDITPYQKTNIKQGYISTDPVIRLRMTDSDFFLTIKGSGTTQREEFELSITENQFYKLWQKVESAKIEKTRYFIPLPDGHLAELDLYANQLEGLITVEVEFQTVEDMLVFQAPEWFGADISEDNRYKNSYLSIHGLP